MTGSRFIAEQLDGTHVGEDISIEGRIAAKRCCGKNGNMLFVDVTDYTGTVQVVLSKSEMPDLYAQFDNAGIGSFVSATGTLGQHKKGFEINPKGIEVIANASLPLSPSPFTIDGLDPKHDPQVFDLRSLYLANPQIGAVQLLKQHMYAALHEYFQAEGFSLIEPPILTAKTLYDPVRAIKANAHGEDFFLTQCATYELEPAALAWKRVYAIAPAFRNERSGSKRHLSEYTHVKAEALMVDMNDLMNLAEESLYHAFKAVAERGAPQLALLGKDFDPELIRPGMPIRITYDEALGIAQARGSQTPWGIDLRPEDEVMVTEHVGNQYVWITHKPFSSEGFPYRRDPSDSSKSLTADLIAPHRAGEMVGIAEKIFDPYELLENMKEKGKLDELRPLWDYVLLRYYGMPPHGGMGAAPQRILYGLLDLPHVKHAQAYPAYPDRKINPPADRELNPWGHEPLEHLIETYDLRSK